MTSTPDVQGVSFASPLRYCTNSAGEGKLINLILIGERPLILTLTINPLKKFKTDVAKFKLDATKYIGRIYDVVVKMLPSNCIRLLFLHRRLFS